MLTNIKAFIQDSDSVLWVITFIGVCVLAGLHVIKPETVEYMMMAVVGRGLTGSKKVDSNG